MVTTRDRYRAHEYFAGGPSVCILTCAKRGRLVYRRGEIQRSTLPARPPTKVRTMVMARAIAEAMEAMKAAVMFSDRAAATRAGPAI